MMILLSAVLTALSMPGMLFGGIIWIAMVPLFMELNNTGPFRGMLKAFVYGYLYLLISHYWVLPVLSVNVPEVLNSFPKFIGALSFFLMGIIMAIPFLGFGFLYGLYRKKLADSPVILSLYAACLFTIFEWLRELGPMGFTGGRLADALTDEIGFLQFLPFAGTLLLVFLIVFVNSFVTLKIGKLKKRERLLYLAGTIAMMLLLNSILERFVPFPPTVPDYEKRLVVIQTNIPQSVKYNDSIDKTMDIIEKAIGEVPPNSTVVLPEATFLYDLRLIHQGERLVETVREKNLNLLVGFPIYDEYSYNQLRLVNSEGFSNEFYGKHKLTPFVEALPWPKFFGIFDFLKFLDFYNAGEEYTTFAIGDQRLGAQICFDSYYAEVARGLVNGGALVVVTATNDGWFGNSPGLEQHLAQCLLRAVENRRYVIQVSNTGITAVIDPFGRVLKRLPTAYERSGDYFVTEFGYVPESTLTFYTRYGDWFLYLILALGVIIIFFGGLVL